MVRLGSLGSGTFGDWYVREAVHSGRDTLEEWYVMGQVKQSWFKSTNPIGMIC